jgi:hypothetical protein
MKQFLTFILELAGLGGLIALLAYVTWTKIVFGGVLALIGAFFPAVRVHSKKTAPDPETGNIRIGSRGFSVAARGTLRALVVLAGIVVITGAVLDGAREERQNRKAANENPKPEIHLSRTELVRKIRNSLPPLKNEGDAQEYARSLTVSNAAFMRESLWVLKDLDKLNAVESALLNELSGQKVLETQRQLNSPTSSLPVKQ